MSELSQTTERYAIVPESVILDRSLTGEELRLLLLLSTYDLPDRSNGGQRKGFVYPSRRELGQRFGCKERRISQLFEALETKKRIRREFVPGRSSRIHLLHTVVSLPPLQEPCKTTLAENVQGGLQETDKGPLQEPCNQKIKNKDRESKSTESQPLVAPVPEAPSPTKSRRSRSDQQAKTREAVQAAIDALDLEKFRKKYQDVDVPREYEKFRDHYLFKNDAKGNPNWQKWSDWNRAFHNWLKNARDWNGNRSQPTRSQPPSAPELPDLSNYTY